MPRPDPDGMGPAASFGWGTAFSRLGLFVGSLYTESMHQRLLAATLALALTGSSVAFLACQLRCPDSGHPHQPDVATESAHESGHGDDGAPDRALTLGGVSCQAPAVLAAANDRHPMGDRDVVVLPRLMFPGVPDFSADLAPWPSPTDPGAHPPTFIPLRI